MERVSEKQKLPKRILSSKSTSSECKVLGEYIDDLSSSITVNDVDQISKSTFSVPKVPESRLESTATPSIGHAQPSTSVDTYGLAVHNQSHLTEKLNGIQCEPNLTCPKGINTEFSDIVVLSVKRKFGGNHYEDSRRKRQKTYHYKGSSRQTDSKRKNASDHSKVDNKRFKSEHVHAADSHSDYEITASCSRLTSPFGENSNKEESEDVQSCPRSCVCKAGPSKLPLFLERKFDTPAPLYKACLLRRIFSLSNTQYMCCKKRCVKKFSRERVMKVCLFHMEEDYYKSDLSVHQYKWGEWTD